MRRASEIEERDRGKGGVHIKKDGLGDKYSNKG